MTPGVAVAVAALAAGLAAFLAVPPRPRGRGSAVLPGLVALLVVAPVVGAMLASGLLVPGIVFGAAGLGGWRWWVLRQRRAGAEMVSSQVLQACEGLAADLTAGLEPGAALSRTARDWSFLDPVVAAHALGSSVPEAFRSVAATPGAADLRVVAAAWDVGRESGPGLATGISQVSRSLRADRATARVVAAELASARATARLLALLPVAVLLLGSGSGGNPWHFLLQTPPGWICLAAGLALAVAGLVWLEVLAQGVTR